MWLLLDLMNGRSPKVDSLARFMALIPEADLPLLSADHRELRHAVAGRLSGEARDLGVTILDVLDGKEVPKALQPFLRELSHGERSSD
jgi:hypothetical protein